MNFFKTKRFLVCLIAAIFLLIVVISMVHIFSLRKININFSVTSKTESQTAEVKNKLNAFLNKSIVFLDTDDMVQVIEQNPYFEVTNIEKVSCNTVDISVKERAECYYITYFGKNYVLDCNGFCLAEESNEYVQSKRLIKLNLVNINISQLQIGSVMQIPVQQSLETAFQMAIKVNLSNCISAMTLYGKSGYAVFETYTGVRIDISKYAVNDGIKMVEEAFNEYHSANDYIRTYNRIIAVTLDSGEIRITWSKEIVNYE